MSTAPFRIVYEPDALPDEHSVVLRCPICGCGGVVQLPVAHHLNTQSVVCSMSGVHVMPNADGRIQTILQFSCEEGHIFGYRITPIGGGTIAELLVVDPQEVSM